MKKEKYLTKSNTKEKVKKWKRVLQKYSKKNSAFSFDINNSALIVIDAQKYFLNKNSHAYIPSSEAVVLNIKKIIDLYKKNNLPIIFTRHAYLKKENPGIMKKWWKDVIYNDNKMSEIKKELLPNEVKIIRKTKYSAFYNTDLEKYLKEKKVKQVLISGFMTNLCCDTTARESFMKDFETCFLIDGTAAYNEELHLASLKALSYGFVIPVETSQIIDEFNK
jgi:isochorismate hydrolase